MPSDLERRLQALHRDPLPGGDEHRRAQEDSLMEAFEQRGPRPKTRRWTLPRLMVAGVLGGAVAVGACALPAEYPVSLGYGLEITIDAARWKELDPEALAQRIGEVPGAERVELHVARSVEQHVADDGSEQTDETMRVQLFVLGDALDTDRMWRELEGDFPALADAEVHDVPLSGTVQGTIGGKLSHRLLDMTLDQHGVEQAERQIMAELLAQGFDPADATIDIEDSVDDAGNRRIEVRVEAEHSQ